MAGLKLLKNVRPVFNAGARTLTFTLPDVATKGRLLAIVLAYDPVDGYVAPVGWEVLNTFVGTAKVVLLARLVDDNEPGSAVFALTTAAKDWLGQLLVYEPGSVPVLLEATQAGNFIADMSPAAPSVLCQQAINLDVRVWSVSGAIVLTAPAGMTALDSYSSALATARSFLIATTVANASGLIADRDAAAAAAATGSGVSYILRDRPPVTPVVMFDPVPGNIGFFGKDTRPARESGLP